MTDARINKSKNDWVSWKNKPYAPSRSDETRRRAELWESFNEFVRLNRGWIVSPPGSRIAILETEKGSELPQKLVQLGYTVNELPGDHSRLTGASLSPEAQLLQRTGSAIDSATKT